MVSAEVFSLSVLITYLSMDVSHDAGCCRCRSTGPIAGSGVVQRSTVPALGHEPSPHVAATSWGGGGHVVQA